MRLNFQPIVERELRVAARRRSTYVTRGLAALLGSGFAIWILGVTISAGGPVNGGRAIFTGLSGCALVACLFAGVFLTADCLSYEKREGTLGLLFLTDLRGHDIVLGKLAATSLTALYGLLAIFPILAIPILLGGVTWWEFARVVTGLIVTLFFSLSVGMMFSSMNRQEYGSMAATGFAVVAWTLLFGLPSGPQALSPLGLHLSAFDGPYQASPGSYLSAVLIVSFLAGVCLLIASKILPNAWEDQPVTGSLAVVPAAAEAKHAGTETGEASTAAPITGAQAAAARRAHTLERNPVEWLVSRRGSPTPLWALTGLGGGLLILTVASGPAISIPVLIIAVHSILKICMAWDASRLLAEHRRTGGLELILVTDLGVNAFLEGCRAALRRRFRGVTRVIIGVDVAVGAILLVAALASGGRGGFGDPMTGIVVVVSVLVSMLLLDLWALSWVGLWLGVRHRWPWQAAFWSVARVMALPWGISFAGMLLGGAVVGGIGWPVALLLLWVLLGFGLSYGFGRQAKESIHADLREEISAWMPGNVRRKPVERPVTEEYYELVR